jgi:large conductance mechanosensitive channel
VSQQFEHIRSGVIVTREFVAFLKNYGVIGLAIAVIIGGKLNALVDAVVKQLLMPFIGLIIPGGDWRELAFTIGETKFGVGPVLAALVDFLIVAIVVFVVSKKILREEVVSKK